MSASLLQRISCHLCSERPMLKSLCRSFIDLMLYPDESHQLKINV